jgi:hypothetical protein
MYQHFNLPENIVRQTHKDDLQPEARSLGRSPHLPPPNAGYGDHIFSFIKSVFVVVVVVTAAAAVTALDDAR